MKIGPISRSKNAIPGAASSKAAARPSSAKSAGVPQAWLPGTGILGAFPVDEQKTTPRLFGAGGNPPGLPSEPKIRTAITPHKTPMSAEKPGKELSDWIATFAEGDQQIVVEAIRHFQQTLHPETAVSASEGELTFSDDVAALILKICDSCRHDSLEVAHQLALAETEHNPHSAEAHERRLRSSLHLNTRQRPASASGASSSSEGGSNPVDAMVPGLKPSGSGPTGPSQNQR